MTKTKTVHCQCGEWSGERCAWTGPIEETVVVEFIPEHLRASHEAARNYGVYPANGAIRIRVHTECAEMMAGEDCPIFVGDEEMRDES